LQSWPKSWESKMELEIYDEEQEQEKVCRVKLIQYGDEIALCAVDKFGNRKNGGSLFTLLPDGTAYRNSSIDEDLGFKLDEKGRICEN